MEEIAISFSYEVREEISGSLPEKDCCRDALLASILEFGGIREDMEGPVLKTPFPRTARFIYRLLKNFSGAEIHWEAEREKFLNKRKIYLVEIPVTQKMLDFISEWGIGKKLRKRNLRRNCCKRAFLQGSYLMSGSFSGPRKFYHFEIVSPSDSTALVLTGILEKMGIKAKITVRKHHDVIYVKRADDIANLLNIMNAHRSLLKFEEIRAIKETKEEVRRRVNCETANLDKTSKAAVRQLNNIRLLKEAGVLLKLPKGLQEIADLRLRFPDISYRELGGKVIPALSKSSVNNRLRRLENIAASYTEKIPPHLWSDGKVIENPEENKS